MPMRQPAALRSACRSIKPPSHVDAFASRPRPSPPALLTPATTVPTGPEWIHELKHDGIRLLARKDGDRVRLWSRHGRNRTSDFATIAAALRMLPDVLIDGEAVAHCENGLPDFHRILSPARERVLLRPCECRE